MAKKEKAFQSEFNSSIRKLIPGVHFYQIPNAPYAPEIIPRPIVKPYDCYMLYKNEFYAFELKVVTRVGAYPLTKIQPQQIPCLLNVVSQGGTGLLVFNINTILTDKHKDIFGIDKPRLNVVFYEHVPVFKQYVESLNAKSIPFSYFADAIRNDRNILHRKKHDNHLVWDVLPLFQ